MRKGHWGPVVLAAAMWIGTGAQANVADFDDLTLDPESYWNGADNSGGFNSGLAGFDNVFTDWGGGFVSWEGFAYSNLSQEAPPLEGLVGQYTAMPGGGQSGANYAIGYMGFYGLPTMTLAEPVQLTGAYFTNNNYGYYAMLNGDGFSKKFGGESGNDEDWSLLSMEGFDSQGGSTGTVEFYLADYRSGDNTEDYIVDEWRWVDLSSLGTVEKIEFSLSSSDVGTYGMNTPAYFAMDTVVPEPASCLILGLGGLLTILRRD